MKSLLYLFGFLAIATHAAPGNPAILRWSSSESLDGEVAGASATELLWKNAAFEEPLRIGWSALRRIDRAKSSADDAGQFGVALRDGSYLRGDQIALAKGTIRLRTKTKAEFSIKSDSVLWIQRLSGNDLLYGGPSGASGWTESRQKGVPTPYEAAVAIRTGPCGALLLPYCNTAAELPLKLPEAGSIDLALRSSLTSPDFSLALSSDLRNGLRVETWSGDLVVALGHQFKLIRKLSDEERDLAIKIFWDIKSRKCAVFDAAGNLLVEWQLPESKGKFGGRLVIENYGHDLAIERLNVRKWDGQYPKIVDLSKSRIELSGGKIETGSGLSSSGDAGSLIRETDQEPLAFAMNDLERVILSSDRPVPQLTPMTLTFGDGTLVHGSLQSIEKDEIILTASFAEGTMRFPLANYRQIRVNPTALKPEQSSPEQKDKLKFRGRQLSGTFVTNDDSYLHWIPAGGTTPSRISPDAAVELIRFIPGKETKPPPTSLFFSRSGEVLPGALVELGKTQVTVKSTIHQTTTLPVEQLAAIQLRPRSSNSVKGMETWAFHPGKARPTDLSKGSVRLESGAKMFHSFAMCNDTVEFTMAGEGWAVIRMRLFAAGLEDRKAPSYLVVRLGGELRSGLETEDGQFNCYSGIDNTNDKPLRVRLFIHESDIEVELDGVLMEKVPIPLEERTSFGLSLEPASVWGNDVEAITVSQFSASSSDGRVVFPSVNQEAKAQTLTIPRLRSDVPPRHILIATNGDLLRGEIEAITPQHLGFRHGLETLQVPRDRVNTIVLPRLETGSQDAVAQDTKEQAATRRLLKQQFRDFGTLSKAGIAKLLANLQDRVTGLKIIIKAPQTERMATITLFGRTAGAVLDEICETFALKSTIEKDGTIVLTPSSGDKETIISRSYWLDTPAFADSAEARKKLSEAGLPAELEVTWDNSAGQLTAVATPEVHARLSQLLESSFGVARCVPSYWVQMTNGGLFPLAVDKFGDNVIEGTHPVYGSFSIPMAQVAKIRTQAPRFSEGNWDMVFAPEPVLPDGAGEASPLLGKEAELFKLPLLAGGEVDLAREKGKVVVLDFWATWCGPCIKSLPEVIETMAKFPPDRVTFIGINQGEPKTQVQRFLDTRGWKLPVALDSAHAVSQKYGVDSIPFTVVIGPDGKVAWVKSGYSPDSAAELAETVKRMMK